MAKLSTENLSFSYESENIIEKLNIKIPEGKITTLIGANGCGKSTILKNLARLLNPGDGVVYLDGKNIHSSSTKEVAKKLAILPQGPIAPEGITVKELCHYGRHPHKGLFSKKTNKDDEMVDWALRATKMKELSHRPLDALSGGQRQRAWISMALAQGTDLLLLDEPTTYLDLAYQIEVLQLLREINSNYNTTIVTVLHDLNQAARYSDHLISIVKGKIYEEGHPEKVFTEKMLYDVFGLNCYIMKDPVENKPLCIPIDHGVRKEFNKRVV